MEKEYKEISDFLDDVHNELSIKETIMDMGFVSKNDFKGQFVPCLFHKDGEERTPSLQITDGFFKCYGCGAKGDT